jgi:hypothetical protein
MWYLVQPHGPALALIRETVTVKERCYLTDLGEYLTGLATVVLFPTILTQDSASISEGLRHVSRTKNQIPSST